MEAAPEAILVVRDDEGAPVEAGEIVIVLVIDARLAGFEGVVKVVIFVRHVNRDLASVDEHLMTAKKFEMRRTLEWMNRLTEKALKLRRHFHTSENLLGGARQEFFIDSGFCEKYFQ